jgi:hypothetical protein
VEWQAYANYDTGNLVSSYGAQGYRQILFLPIGTVITPAAASDSMGELRCAFDIDHPLSDEEQQAMVAGGKSVLVTDTQPHTLALYHVVQDGHGGGIYPSPYGIWSNRDCIVVGVDENGIPQGTFYDVSNNAYYFDAVEWAVKEKMLDTYTRNFGGIYTGIKFLQPDSATTRMDFVDYFYDYGHRRPFHFPASSEVEAPDFEDVTTAADKSAVSWAYKRGITLGTSETTFSPDKTCTRAEIVTMLWRGEGCPQATQDYTQAFWDVSEGDYYYDAVNWAIEQGLTNGTSSETFSPHQVCSKAESITFLYRLYGA